MVSLGAMRGQRVVETMCRCWNPAIWLLVTLLGSLVLVAVSVLLQFEEVKMHRRSVQPQTQYHNQTQYHIQLVNGRNHCEGRVEVHFNGSVGTVCDDDWDMVDANVVCQQLGCGVATLTGSSSRFGQGSGLIVLDNVDCRGGETDLSQCHSLGWGINNCYHYEDVGVVCKELSHFESRTFEDHTTSPQVNFGTRAGTIRLVNGQNSCEGRVEIFNQGKWGTVCDDDWNLRSAQVVCQQVGCGHAKAAPTNSYFGHGRGLILLDNVQCEGIEQNLTKCRSRGWGVHNCGHHEDAGVVCSGVTTTQPATTDIQKNLWETQNTQATHVVLHTELLTTTTVTTPVQTRGRSTIRVVNGNSSCQGRVEVLYKTIWGTVCDDDWDLLNAHVVCRQLGCGPARRAMSQAHFGYGSGPILLDNVKCSGPESGLSECFHLGWGQHNCGHHEDAGVICESELHRIFRETEIIPTTVTQPTTTHPSEGTLRLLNGQHRCEGRVEIYINSEWGTVCDDAWDLPDAQVVCRSLSCGEATGAWGDAHFGPGTGTILLDNLKCVGSESSLKECSHISWDVHNCDHSEDAGVTCSLS
ncbi:scavenger receptor cysteine-rich domain-containing group B protein isoform X1 [Gouania willdenowi]|nr:scavenger receptor cysteine-rich domain-containing group B protein isoform X1 [Gouania willdenowi]